MKTTLKTLVTSFNKMKPTVIGFNNGLSIIGDGIKVKTNLLPEISGSQLWESIYPKLKTASILSDSFQIEERVDGVNLKAGGAKFFLDIDKTSTIEFPTVKGKPVKIKAEDLTKHLPFLSKDLLRPAMNCLCIDSENICGTDGHMLTYIKHDYKLKFPAKKEPQFKEFADDQNNVLIPGKVLQLIKDLKVKDLDLTIGEEMNLISIGEIDIYFSVDERFPDYRNVIPEKHTKKALIVRKPFLDAVKKAVLCTNKYTNLIKLRFDKDKLTVVGEDLDMGSYISLDLDCKFTGDPIYIGFNGKFLQNLISISKETEMVLEMTDPNRAGVIDGNTLIMPMRIED